MSISGLDATFSIWDIGGHSDFESMLPLVCNDAAALLFMFDLTRPETLESIREWHRKARERNKCVTAHETHPRRGKRAHDDAAIGALASCLSCPYEKLDECSAQWLPQVRNAGAGGLQVRSLHRGARR